MCFSSDITVTFQGAVETLKLAVGGSVAKAGVLTDCPFQGDSSSLHNTGNQPFLYIRLLLSPLSKFTNQVNSGQSYSVSSQMY